MPAAPECGESNFYMQLLRASRKTPSAEQALREVLCGTEGYVYLRVKLRNILLKLRGMHTALVMLTCNRIPTSSKYAPFIICDLPE